LQLRQRTYRLGADLDGGAHQQALERAQRRRHERSAVHDPQEVREDGRALQPWCGRRQQRFPSGPGARQAGRAIQPGRGLAFNEGEILFKRRQGPHIAVICLAEPEHGGRLHPVEQARIVGVIRDPVRRAALDVSVHPHHLRDQPFRRRTRAVHGHHGRKAGAAQAHARIALEAAPVPDARADRGFGQLEQHRRHAADEQRDRIGEHPPGHPVLRRQRRLARRLAEIEGHARGWLQQFPYRLQHPLAPL
jgi:hypothetical protein